MSCGRDFDHVVTPVVSHLYDVSLHGSSDGIIFPPIGEGGSRRRFFFCGWVESLHSTAPAFAWRAAPVLSRGASSGAPSRCVAGSRGRLHDVRSIHDGRVVCACFGRVHDLADSNDAVEARCHVALCLARRARRPFEKPLAFEGDRRSRRPWAAKRKFVIVT